MKKFLILIALISSLSSLAQKSKYIDSLTKFRSNYIIEHEVVKGEDKKQMDFFPLNEAYAIQARFETIQQPVWFNMETSGKQKQIYRPYGVLHFNIQNRSFKLNVYQSKDLIATTEYADYLFVPFTDSTNGETTYENGRYIDFRLKDLAHNNVLLDFNKAYNPYCAYITGIFNCPIPPSENNLTIAIEAGEKKYRK